MQPASPLTTAFLGTISLAQCLRVVLGLEIQIGRTLIPPWMSLVASLFCGVLAVGLYRETRRAA